MKFLERTTYILLCIFVLSILNLPYFSDIKEIVKNIATNQPIQEAVISENNFLSVFLGYDFIMKELKPDIKLPFSDYKLEQGIFYFEPKDNLFLKSGADGIVKNIGYMEDKKYIEVLHDGNIKSVFVNVDIIGVNTNLKVKKGEILSTIKQDSTMLFYITYNDELLTDFVVKNGDVVWKD